MDNTRHRIKAILVNDLFVERQPDEISDTESLRNSLGLDSVGFIELRLQVEQRFGTTIADDEFTPETFATVETLADFIERRAAASIGASEYGATT